MKNLLTSFIIVLTIGSSFAKLPDISSQLECLSDLDSMDQGENQPDEELFGIEIRNNIGYKTLLLDRKKKEYLIFTENEVRVCKLPQNIRGRIKLLSDLGLKVQGSKVSIEVDLSKNTDGKLNINSVAFAAKKNFPKTGLKEVNCVDRLDPDIKSQLIKYSKSRILMTKKHCLSLKNSAGEWSHDLDKMYCEQAFLTCSQSSLLKEDSTKALKELFPKTIQDQSSSGSATSN